MDNQRQREFYRLRLAAQSIIKTQTPYRTGLLRNSIHTVGGFNSFTVVIGGEAAPYVWSINEQSRSKSRGFLDKAADLVVANILTTMKVKRG